MAFSLSGRPPSGTLRRNGGSFVLVMHFNRFVFIKFVRDAAFAAVIAYQVRAESIELNNLVHIAFKACGARHTADDADVVALRVGHPARSLALAQPLGPIFTH